MKNPDSYTRCSKMVKEWFDDHPFRNEVAMVVLGESGLRWVFCPDHPSAASYIHVEATPKELQPGYDGFRGYAGATLEFKTTDGILKLTAPWHSNPTALFEDTGVDLRDKCVTMGMVGTGHTAGNIEDIVYDDKRPQVGTYDRIKLLAGDMAQQLGTLYYCMASYGGGTIKSTVRGVNDEKELS